MDVLYREPAGRSAIHIVDAPTANSLLSQDEAIEVVRQCFADLDSGLSIGFPPLSGHGSDKATRFGVKSGYDGRRQLPGLKVGSYWPHNTDRGLPNHGSTTLLLDDATGFPLALVSATYLNALRTAASDAVAVDLLARKNASVLAVFGTGHQAFHEAIAISRVRSLSRVFVCGRDTGRAAALAQRLSAAGLDAEAASADKALEQADMVVTATASRAPLFSECAVKPGTHVSAMGADGPGKQELPAALAARAELFADALDQTFSIGEFQYLAETEERDRVTAIGSVINGRSRGRSSDDAITIYDSSGISLQDLAVAGYVFEKALAAGLTQFVDV
ncbi:MAG: ornithine cyclodeaminase family protein [Sphingosinicella sp.]|nr:ornithine cyclodeaminase family protein [Sphingosinicella sp.]